MYMNAEILKKTLRIYAMSINFSSLTIFLNNKNVIEIQLHIGKSNNKNMIIIFTIFSPNFNFIVNRLMIK